MPPKKHRQKKQLAKSSISETTSVTTTVVENGDVSSSASKALLISEMILEEKLVYNVSTEIVPERVKMVPYESGAVICEDCARKHDKIAMFYLPEFSEMVSCTSYFTNMRRVNTLNMLRRIWTMDFSQTEDLEERRVAASGLHYSPVPVGWIPKSDGARGEGEYVFGLSGQKIEEEIIRLKKIVYQPP